MRIPFRQGLVRYQTDIADNPVFLAKSNGGSSIDLVVSPDATEVSFAHRQADYLFRETTTIAEAWSGFSAGTDYWLYWDIDLVTAARTFGYTTVEPISQPNQPSTPAIDQHWFDTAKTIMKVWNGSVWREVVRVFACMYDEGAIIVPYPTGTQVGLNYPVDTGFILFDEDEVPIRKFRKGRRNSEFLTTESTILAHLAGGAASFNLGEGVLTVVEAVETIPQYHLVAWAGLDKIQLASHADVDKNAVGIVTVDLISGANGTFLTGGTLTNESWNWTAAPGTPLFIGASGQLSLSVPQTGAIQQVGTVVSKEAVFIDIKQLIEL